MSDKTEYKVQLVQNEEIPAPDDLIAGEYKADSIKLTEAGEYKRGTLLMAGAEGFVNATSEGLSGAEVCILCDDITVPDDNYAEAAGYFSGTFRGSAIILPYEGEDDDHVEQIESVRGKLRVQGIFVV